MAYGHWSSGEKRVRTSGFNLGRARVTLALFGLDLGEKEARSGLIELKELLSN